MNLLPLSDLDKFDSFFQWCWDQRYKDKIPKMLEVKNFDNIKFFSRFIMFGIFGIEISFVDTHYKFKICPVVTCKYCEQYSRIMCLKRVENNFSDEQETIDLIKKRMGFDISGWLLWDSYKKLETYYKLQVSSFIGRYRVEIFEEELAKLAIDSVRNVKSKGPFIITMEIPKIETKYYSAKDIIENDMWSKYKNKIDKEDICSLLLDF